MLVTVPRPPKILQRAYRAGSTEGGGMCSLTGISPVILCLRLHRREHCVRVGGMGGWGVGGGAKWQDLP